MNIATLNADQIETMRRVLHQRALNSGYTHEFALAFAKYAVLDERLRLDFERREGAFV